MVLGSVIANTLTPSGGDFILMTVESICVNYHYEGIFEMYVSHEQ